MVRAKHEYVAGNAAPTLGLDLVLAVLLCAWFGCLSDLEVEGAVSVCTSVLVCGLRTYNGIGAVCGSSVGSM